MSTTFHLYVYPAFIFITLFFAMCLETEGFSAVVANQSQQKAIKLTWEMGVEKAIREACQSMQRTLGVDRPLMVSVTGIPGSGKSTSAEILAKHLSDIGCVLMPHDGYHISQHELLAMPNAVDKLYRRGAPDTFDPHSLLADLRRIRDGTESDISVPGFDHARGDPDRDAHTFHRSEHKIVICEGLYLLHEQNGWESIPPLFDLSIYVEADLDTCMDRLKIRNLCIPGYTPDEIRARVDAVDRENAKTVIQSRTKAKIVVQSAAA